MTYRYEEPGGIKLDKIGVESSMAAHLSLLVAQFFGLTNFNQSYPYLVQGCLFCTLCKKKVFMRPDFVKLCHWFPQWYS